MVGTTLSNDFPLFSFSGFNDQTFSSIDGYIMKFGAYNLDTLWSSYFSESAATTFTSISIDDNNWKYIGGGTNDPNLHIVPQTSLYNQNSLLGIPYSSPQTDAYLVVFNNNEDIIYATFIGGKPQPFTNENEMIYDLNVINDQLYLVGLTSSNDSTITYPTFDPGNLAYFEPYYMGGSTDAFITLICTNLINGINEKPSQKVAQGISIYPNPANNNLFVEFSDVENLASFDLVNNTGQTIKQFPQSTISNGRVNISIENLHAGIYIIKANYLTKIESSKFIKQ
jgi:hypothetical protein